MEIRRTEITSCNIDEDCDVFVCKKCNCEVIMPYSNDYSFCPYCGEPIFIKWGE